MRLLYHTSFFENCEKLKKGEKIKEVAFVFKAWLQKVIHIFLKKHFFGFLSE